MQRVDFLQSPIPVITENDETRAYARVESMDARTYLRALREEKQNNAAWLRARVAHHMDRAPFSISEAQSASFESIRKGVEGLALELAVAGCELSPNDKASVVAFRDSINNIKHAFHNVPNASARISEKEIKQTKSYEGCPVSRSWNANGVFSMVSFKASERKNDILDDATPIAVMPGDPVCDFSDVGSDELQKVLARGPGSVEPSNPDARMGSEEWNQVMREIRRDAEAKAMRKAVRIAKNMARGEPARATDRQRRRENWELRHAHQRAAWESGFRVGAASAS